MPNQSIGSGHGQCLCGAVAYDVKKLEPAMGHCHCSMCRKFHGAAFATFGEAKAENFCWTRGEELLSEYTADNGTKRRFCSVCGSSMTFAPANDTGDIIEFALGTFETDPVVRPDVHIYTDYKALWYDIADNLPRYKSGRDSDSN